MTSASQMSTCILWGADPTVGTYGTGPKLPLAGTYSTPFAIGTFGEGQVPTAVVSR